MRCWAGARTGNDIRKEREAMKENLEKYQLLRGYLAAFDSEMKMLLRMVDGILEEVESPGSIQTSPGLCLSVRDQAVRIRSILSSRLVALEDLISILRDHGIEIGPLGGGDGS